MTATHSVHWQIPNHNAAQFIQEAAFAYQRHADQDAPTPALHPVVLVGAGPVGLTLALDLAQHGQRVVLLDNDSRLSTGSRAICFAKRSLEIFDRLGCGQPMVDKGVSWNKGKVFFHQREVYAFDLLAEAGHERPAFINLQQYYVEAYLLEAVLQHPLIDLRWRNSLSGLEQSDTHCRISVDTPEGAYTLDAQYLVACDGARSATRKAAGLESFGRSFKDRFLIADIKMKAGFPPERWFWFDPPFHPKQSVLLHRQPDDVWRIDFQLGWDADPEAEKRPEAIIARVQAMLGHDVQFELEWASVYTFACVRMEKFRHGRVLFTGDAAHGVSPFGARGANSGIQDADNLGWKLARVLRGDSPDALLNSYASEREAAADENIVNSTRATDFITPKSAISRLFRDATLRLSQHHAFARRLVNSGRLSVPAVLHDSPLNTADAPDAGFAHGLRVGSPAADAPLTLVSTTPDVHPQKGWLLRQLHPQRFNLLMGIDATSAPTWMHQIDQINAQLSVNTDTAKAPKLIFIWPQDSKTSTVLDALKLAPELTQHTQAIDHDGLLAQRYQLNSQGHAAFNTAYLLRPDQHVCARWADALQPRWPQLLLAAIDKACGL